MLVDLFLAPGQFLCRRLPSNRKRGRHPLRPAAIRGPVIPLSAISWAFLVALTAWLVFELASPPLPEPKLTLVSSAEAGVGTLPKSPPSAPQPSSRPQMAAAVAAGSTMAAGAALAKAIEPPPAPLESVGAQVWLVIVESIPKRARTEAERSLARHKKKGLELELLDTDAYPMLKGGMWTLAMGPFDTKGEADAAAASLKPKVRDLMVRRGL